MMCDGSCFDCGYCGNVVGIDDKSKKKTFWVDFSGYCEIEAETAEEANQKFWDMVINNDMPQPQEIYSIDKVEEKTE